MTVCVCVCVRARVCVCVCARVCAWCACCFSRSNRAEDVIARQRAKEAKFSSKSGGGPSAPRRVNRGPEPPQMQFGDVDFSDEEYSSEDC